MSCEHANPRTHQYCSQCGEKVLRALCSCGFEFGGGDRFCGLCGAPRLEVRDTGRENPVEHRFDIDELLQVTERVDPGALAQHVRVSQDDIDQMFA